MNINFEGEVNGQKFTDLESFMKALNALKDDKNNKSISLSYQTSWDDKNTKDEVKNGLAGLFQNKKKNLKQPRPIDPNKIVEDFDFDQLNGEANHDDFIQDELSAKLYDKYKDFAGGDYDEEQLKGYLDINNKRLCQYSELLKRNEDKIVQIEDLIEAKRKEIDSLQHSLDICNHVKEAQEDLIQYHEEIKELIENNL